MAWLSLTIYDVKKPGKTARTLIDPDRVSDFYAESMRDDDDELHEFTVVAFANSSRAVRVKESIGQIEIMLSELAAVTSYTDMRS